MSLAPWKYRNIIGNSTSPIDAIKTIKTSGPFLSGYTQAYAYFNREFSQKLSYPHKLIYGQSAGSGTAKSKIEAIHKAVSEAIERWAYWHTKGSKKFGFDLENNTTGMACYPNFINNIARVNALFEARERWALKAFWEKGLCSKLHHCQRSGLSELTLATPWNEYTIIVFCNIPGFEKYRAYGFSHHKDRCSAKNGALVELERNIRSLTKYLKTKERVPPVTLNERRLLYFATNEGQIAFDATIEDNYGVVNKHPTLVIDTKVEGSWSKFSTVWRCLYDQSDFINNDSIKYFYF